MYDRAALKLSAADRAALEAQGRVPHWRFKLSDREVAWRDLIRSVPDALASTANYLLGYGWQRGGALAEDTHNLSVLKEWNRAQVYQKTIALFVQRLQSE